MADAASCEDGVELKRTITLSDDGTKDDVGYGVKEAEDAGTPLQTSKPFT